MSEYLTVVVVVPAPHGYDRREDAENGFRRALSPLVIGAATFAVVDEGVTQVARDLGADEASW